MAMMMVVEMRPRVHLKKIKKIVSGVNNGFFLVGCGILEVGWVSLRVRRSLSSGWLSVKLLQR